MDLSGERLSPWEVEQIRFMDSVVTAAIQKKEKPSKDTDDGGHKDPITEVQD